MLHLALVALLLVGSASARELDAAKLRELDAAVEAAIAQKRIPGGVVWLERGDGATYRRAYGNRALVPAVEPMTLDTIFDAASITKIVATAPSVWLLIERGLVDLDAPAKRYLPELGEDTITVRHLLTHTSGFRPGIPRFDAWSGYDEGIRRALAERPRNRPGAVFRYSDINFILLGELVRRVTGQPLDVFATRHIFEPLGMRDTFFRPASRDRVAPTEQVVPEGMLHGVVHDPTSRRMGGVAGHAGMFTTASDLARFARMILAGGGNVLSAATVQRMTSVQSPPEVAVRRAGGFDIDSAYSRARGDRFPIGSFGHSGWTGGFLWIDPYSRSFYVFLSNRVHPDGKGSVVALQRRLGTLAAEAMGIDNPDGGLPARAGGRVHWVTFGADVQNGIDTLHASDYAMLRGLRIGLITNHTGTDRAGNPTVDLLRSAPGVQLVALFSPEHGIRGTLDDKVADEIDRNTGLTIQSLYGERRKPTPEQLRGLDALVFDIQDIGTRFYTYISTMGLAMEAAAEAKIPFVVLDRVNPISGAVVEGPVLEGETHFTAWHPIPVRHGMTAGELAKMFRDERRIAVDLHVVPLGTWKREQYQDEAGLPWINTSPNMRSLTAATLYPGIGLVEFAISVGRGTPTPFEILGAPYIDGHVLARELAALQLPGITFAPTRFTPTASTFKGQECGGVRITITDRKALRAVDTGVAIAAIIARLYPTQFDLTKVHALLRHTPTLDAIRRGDPCAAMSAARTPESFLDRRGRYLLY